MKKLFTTLLCITLSLCLATSVFAVSEWSADFEALEQGGTEIGLSFSENTETSIIEVDYDPLDETNKVLKIDHDGESDRYMSITGDFSNKTVINLKFQIYKF